MDTIIEEEKRKYEKLNFDLLVSFFFPFLFLIPKQKKKATESVTCRLKESVSLFQTKLTEGIQDRDELKTRIKEIEKEINSLLAQGVSLNNENTELKKELDIGIETK